MRQADDTTNELCSKNISDRRHVSFAAHKSNFV